MSKKNIALLSKRELWTKLCVLKISLFRNVKSVRKPESVWVDCHVCFVQSSKTYHSKCRGKQRKIIYYLLFCTVMNWLDSLNKSFTRKLCTAKLYKWVINSEKRVSVFSVFKKIIRTSHRGPLHTSGVQLLHSNISKLPERIHQNSLDGQ